MLRSLTARLLAAVVVVLAGAMGVLGVFVPLVAEVELEETLEMLESPPPGPREIAAAVAAVESRAAAALASGGVDAPESREEAWRALGEAWASDPPALETDHWVLVVGEGVALGRPGVAELAVDRTSDGELVVRGRSSSERFEARFVGLEETPLSPELVERLGPASVVVLPREAHPGRPAPAVRYLRGLRLHTFALLAGLLAVGVGAAFVLLRWQLRPVRRLIGATRALERGETPAPVPVERDDELGTLARSFNHAIERLREDEADRRRLVADVAHELRTPLTNLVGQVEGAIDGVLALDEGLLAVLADQVGVLRRLVDDLEELSLAEVGALPLHLADLDAAEVLEDVAESFRAARPEARILVEAVPAPVRVDPVRLHQMLGNLVRNALDHGPPRGAIRLSCAPHDDRVVLAVEDGGPGIPEERRERIFRRFVRGDPARGRASGGAGLGLAIVRELARAHGGEARLSAGAGFNRFEIEIPRADLERAPTAGPSGG